MEGPKVFFADRNFNEQSMHTANTLIVPLVSSGNVGQLAIDLVLKAGFEEKFSVEKAGTIDSEDILPVAGYDCYKEREVSLCTNAEVFLAEDKRAVILQIRAPVVQGREASFSKSLLSWAKEVGFEQVLVLAGASSDQSHEDAHGVIFHPCWTMNHHADKNPCSLTDSLKTSEFSTLPLTSAPAPEDQKQPYSDLPQGSGICKHFFKAGDDLELPVVGLLKHCKEGNNLQDGIELASSLNQIIPFINQANEQEGGMLNWSFPASWHSIFGCVSESI
mmetsp:Transcript_30200/g.39799  ORF Transcript_30200/g.39799 Transcript_30200/m.39799 type:complete len:276 (+) Transcript_30200:105-932(+)